MRRQPWFPILLKISFFTGFVIFLILLIKWMNEAIISKWSWIMTTYFFFLTLGGIILIMRKTAQNIDSFAKYYFGVMISRLLLAVLFVAAGLYFEIENTAIFVTNFLILYLFYLGFEIYYLITNFQSRTGR